MVRAFTHGAMGRRIDPLTVDPLSYFSFQRVFHDWCNKCPGMCHPGCGMVHIIEPLLLNRNVAHVREAGFIYRYINSPLPYIRRHKTLNKIC